jgi:integrase
MRVPPDCQPKLKGKRLIVEALGTSDPRIAEGRKNRRLAYYTTLFAALRGDAEARADVRRDIYALALARAHEERPEAQEIGDDDGISFAMDLIVDEARQRKVPLDDAGYPVELPADLQAQYDALQDYRSEIENRPKPRRDKYALTFSETAQRYLAGKLDKTSNQTRIQHEAVYRLFSGFIGDKPLYKVTKADAVQFFDEVRDFHRDWGRSPVTKERTYAEVKALFWKKGGQLEGRTLQRYASHLGGLWEWSDGRGEVTGRNPFDGLVKVQKRKKGDNTYQPFTIDELNALFAELPKQRWLWEVALVALYSGMRANEICSLTWDNIKRDQGVWYFDVVEAKSVAGVRPVPIHSRLLWLLERRPKTSTGLLWPALKPGGPDNKHAHYYTKRFRAWRVDRKVTGKGKVFHSFRKNVVRCFELLRVPQNEAAEIVGHEKEGITYRVYNPDGLTMKQRRDIVEKIKYPGFKKPPPV